MKESVASTSCQPVDILERIIQFLNKKYNRRVAKDIGYSQSEFFKIWSKYKQNDRTHPTIAG